MHERIMANVKEVAARAAQIANALDEQVIATDHLLTRMKTALKKG